MFVFSLSIFGQDSNIIINAMNSINNNGQFTVQFTDNSGNYIVNQEKT